jgi:hypothetical protein
MENEKTMNIYITLKMFSFIIGNAAMQQLSNAQTNKTKGQAMYSEQKTNEKTRNDYLKKK